MCSPPSPNEENLAEREVPLSQVVYEDNTQIKRATLSHTLVKFPEAPVFHEVRVTIEYLTDRETNEFVYRSCDSHRARASRCYGQASDHISGGGLIKLAFEETTCQNRVFLLKKDQ
jgi:hypothetical protein